MLNRVIAAACLVPAVLAVTAVFIQAALDGQPARWQDLTFQASEWMILGALSPLAYRLYRRWPLTRDRWGRALAIHGLGALALCAGWASLGVVVGALLHHYPAEGPLGAALVSWMLITLPYSVFMYFAVLGCVAAFAYFAVAKEREAQLAEARLGALRMQLNPHFLFNSLNALAVLVRDQKTRPASRMLELLGDVLRAVLRSDGRHEVALDDELAFIRQVLEIEEVRFSDRLRVDWDIDERVRTALVPTFILQPLVENAIKHGVARRAEAGRIIIAARVAGPALELSVSDDGPGPGSTADGPGVGLANTRARLATLYGSAAQVMLAPLATGGACATLVLPFRPVSP